MGIRVPLPGLVIALFPALLIPFSAVLWGIMAQEVLAPPSQEALPADTDTAKAAQAILARVDGLPMGALWDSVRRLESLGKDVLPALQGASKRSGGKARLAAAKAILSLGGEAARRDALKELAALAREKEADKEVRVAAVEILGQEDPEGSVELVRQVYEQAAGDPDLLIPSARILYGIEQDLRAQAAIRRNLLDLVGSRDSRVRYSAALALAAMDAIEGEVREALRELRREPSERGRLAASLLDLDLAARRDERALDAGEKVLPGADALKVLQEKAVRIRELEAQIEGMARSRGGSAGGDPVLEEIIEKIQSNYIDPEKSRRKDLILSAIKGMARSLDDYSTFFDVEETDRFLKDFKGEYFGIGAQVSKLAEDGPLEVVKPIYGGGAYECGIRTGDKITEIDGLSTEERPLEEIVEKLLKGPGGTTVAVKVIRRGWVEPREFKIPRRIVTVPTVFHEMLPGSIGYLKLTIFGDRSAEDFQKALAELEAGKMEALILDLRFNPGGKLDVALRIADLFIGDNKPLLTRKDRDGAEVVSTPSTPGDRPNYPMAVLINGRSASASEIVAGDLKDYHRAVLVGQRTYGKGSVQTLLPLSAKAKEILGGETRLKLTTQLWFLPSGRCIQTVRDQSGRMVQGGIEADISVEMEQYPAWLAEEVERIRSSEKIFDYINRNFADLKPLGLEGDGRDASRWKDFDALYRTLDTKASPDHVRRVLRYHFRRRLEDEMGREFPSDFQEDNQIQRAILEVFGKLGKDPAEVSAYAWLKGKEFPGGKGK